VQFSTFLELFGANATAVVEVRKEEIKVDLSNMSRRDRAVVTSHLAEMAVARWITDNFPDTELERDEKLGDFVWRESGGASVLIDIKFFDARTQNVQLYNLKQSLERMEQLSDADSFSYDNVICFLVFESIEECEKIIGFVRRMMNKNRDESRVVFAIIASNGSLNVLDPFRVLPVFG
jgi:hypothetical protein